MLRLDRPLDLVGLLGLPEVERGLLVQRRGLLGLGVRVAEGGPAGEERLGVAAHGVVGAAVVGAAHGADVEHEGEEGGEPGGS